MIDCRQKLVVLLAILISSSFLFGCGLMGKGPYLQLHVCVKNDEGLSEFVGLMQSIANAENLGFEDWSHAIVRSYQLAPKTEYKLPVVAFSMFGLNGKDDSGILASNLELFPYQFSVGFLEGMGDLSEAERLNAQRFADTVVKELEKRWTVNPPPPGSGVVPRDDCVDAPASAPTDQNQ